MYSRGTLGYNLYIDYPVGCTLEVLSDVILVFFRSLFASDQMSIRCLR
jgi:hypothetical protein